MTAKEERNRGADTRKRILRSAVALASAEGLEALTIGRLAGALSLSKAGLFGHFGSKEELQIATLEAAGVDFTEQVVLPAGQAEPGLPRLFALLSAWFDYAERSAGGCFFASVAAEFDGRTGPVRERVAALVGQWWSLLTQVIEEAQRCAHLPAGLSARELALELYGLELAANLARQLLGDSEAMRVARERARAQLLREASALGRAKLAPPPPPKKRLRRAAGSGAATDHKRRQP